MKERSSLTVLVTGGAGFIGSNLIREILQMTDWKVLNFDKLTYAGNLKSLDDVSENPRYSFIQADICDANAVRKAIREYRPEIVFHLAAESHVDRSIDAPGDFIQTNVVGTYNLLEQSLSYYRDLPSDAKKRFRFLHVSTDEVFGSLPDSGLFSESTPYDPRSPYSASKASSDHLARAWHHTFGLPILITNCSNNYGPFQYPEKLIPVVILNAISERPIPVYGKGQNTRDWLFVQDHAAALIQVAKKGRPGETYLVSGRAEKKNIDLVQRICGVLDLLKPRGAGSYSDLITYVSDRPGHDWRYAIDPSKIETEIGWKASVDFEQGIRKTVEWYLTEQKWCVEVSASSHSIRQGLAQGRAADKSL